MSIVLFKSEASTIYQLSANRRKVKKDVTDNPLNK